MPVANTQYKIVGVQRFARVWFSYQHSCRWTGTQPENPTVSYFKTLCGILKKKQNRQQMKISHIIVLTLTMSIILACASRQDKNTENLTEIYSLMFKDALKNQTTAPDFVVYIAKTAKLVRRMKFVQQLMTCTQGK